MSPRLPTAKPTESTVRYGLACPRCGHNRFKVHKNRPAKDNALNRIRICLKCEYRFTTKERIPEEGH